MKNALLLTAAVLLLVVAVQAQVQHPYYEESKSVQIQPIAGAGSSQCSLRDNGLLRGGVAGCRVEASLRGQSLGHHDPGDNEILIGDIITPNSGQQAVLSFSESNFAQWHGGLDTTKTQVFSYVDLSRGPTGGHPYIEVCDVGIGSGGIFWSTGTYSIKASRESTPVQQ